MEVKPSDIVLALMQFLEILLPGAILSFSSLDFADAHIFGQILPKPHDPAQNWVAFFFASYLLGHFVFLIASFLDKYAYDPARKAWRSYSRDLAFQHAKAIKTHRVGDAEMEVVNTFQWVKATMNLTHPAALAEIKRSESDSKFFRSLVIVFFVFALQQCFRGAWLNILGCAAFSLLSFWRYFDQRWKSTQIAYTHLIAMERLNELVHDRPRVSV